MWGIKMRFNLGLAALAATLVVATPAVAQQSSATATAKGVVLEPVTLTWVSDLDFGTVAGSATAGTVTVDPDSGLRSAASGVTLVPSGFSRAEFQGLGQAGQTVGLTLTPPAGNVLVGPGGATVSVNSMTLDSAGASRVLGGSGAFTVYVGGTFGIAANQANGAYSALFQLTANYQ
jgi:hypothetical protein